MTICILAQFRSFVHRLWFCWRRDYGQLVMLKKKRVREREKKGVLQSVSAHLYEKSRSHSVFHHSYREL